MAIKTNLLGNIKTIMKKWFNDKDEIEEKLSEKAEKVHNHNDLYYTKSEDNERFAIIDNKLDALVGFSATVVDELPSKGEEGIIYLIQSEDGKRPDLYEEYIWVNNDYEKIGNTEMEVDLTPYATKVELESGLNNKAEKVHDHDERYPTKETLQNGLDGKADKEHTHNPVSGSTNGFMIASDKTKLDGIQQEANKYVLPTASANTLGGVKVGNNLSIDGNGVLSATGKTYENATTTTDGLMSASDKNKLDILKAVAGKSISTPFELGSEAYIGYIKSKAKWFVNASNGNDNNGTSETTPAKTIGSLVSKVAEGDIIYVESGTYTENVTFDKDVSIYGNPRNPPIWTSDNASKMLTINANRDCEICLENIIFESKTTVGTGRGACNINGQDNDIVAKIQNCQFKNGKEQWSSGGLAVSGIKSNNGMMLVCDCSFINNTGTSYGHSAASCQLASRYGLLRVYRCLFNNPKSASMYFCGSTGVSISIVAGYDSIYGNGEGCCNLFLGEGDTCTRLYTEKECA